MTNILNLHGRNWKDLIPIARKLGVRMEPVRRTGEQRWWHELMVRPVTFNGRRKDATRALTHWLKRLLDQFSGPPGGGAACVA